MGKISKNIIKRLYEWSFKEEYLYNESLEKMEAKLWKIEDICKDMVLLGDTTTDKWQLAYDILQIIRSKK